MKRLPPLKGVTTPSESERDKAGLYEEAGSRPESSVNSLEGGAALLPKNENAADRAHNIARELHSKYEKQAQKWADYQSLFVFVAFVSLFLAALYMQRNAQVAYQVHSTLSTILPTKRYMDSSAKVVEWIKSVLKEIWKDPACGDGLCESPFEFASYGRFGCRADCGKLSEVQELTTVGIDLYFDFNHPFSSIPAADLMTQAAWNLCPKDGAPHGKDCYYLTDQQFESISGEVHVTLADIPDGEWEVHIKRDFFQKVRGAVRIMERIDEQGAWDRKYGAYLAARADQEFELRAINESMALANRTVYNFTMERLKDEFDNRYTQNLANFSAGRLDEAAYIAANATTDTEYVDAQRQIDTATCRCDDLGVTVDFEIGCQGSSGDALVDSNVSLSETDICENIKAKVEEAAADRLAQVRTKLTEYRLGRQGVGGKIGARAAKKAELRTYVKAAKPEVYDATFASAKGQSPERDANLTNTKFDVLAKYLSDGPTGYLDPSLLSAQLKLITREVNNATLDELKLRCQDRVAEIAAQQEEVDDMDQVVSMLRIYRNLPANFTTDPLPNILDYNYKTWNGSTDEYLRCNLPLRSPKYIGACVEIMECTRANESVPFTCPSDADLDAEDCDDGCNHQIDCNSICECDAFQQCGASQFCECPVCRDLPPAASTQEFQSIQSIAEGGGAASADLVGRRKARKLKQSNDTDFTSALQDLQSGVTGLRSGQSELKAQIQSLQGEVEAANAQADERAKDGTLQQLINQGRQEIADGQARVEGMLEEIIGKQNQALEAAEEARKTLAALEDMAVKAAAAQQAVERAVREQLNTIKVASAQNLITLTQALELWKRARRDRLLANKKVELASLRCSRDRVVGHGFGVDNYDDVVLASSRERNIGLTNRVIAGMLVHTVRTRPVKCPDSRFKEVENECTGGVTSISYGVDPVFKAGTSLFNPDLDNTDSMQTYYNCSELAVASYGLRDPYAATERYVNQYPFCAELFNMRNIPYGFRAFVLEGKRIGFPVWFDINLSEDEAQRWYAYLEEGLYVDTDTAQVTAEMVTYNSELKVFGYARVTFTFTEGGSIVVTHKLQTLKVELYVTPRDFARLAVEVLWTLCVVAWLVRDLWAILRARIYTGTCLKYLASFWVWLDLISNALMAVAVGLWWIFVQYYATPFSIDLRYDVYDDPSPVANFLKLEGDGVNLVAAHKDFRRMQQLVDMLSSYYALNGISILILIVRLLRRMHFQPRLGVVTRSLALAGPDLVHFSLVSGMVFIGYAMMAHLIFGNAVAAFSTFGKSVNTCFEVLLGDISVNEDLKALSGLQALAGTLFFWSFELLVFMVLLNFLLAIIVDAFSEVKGNTSDMTGMHVEITQMVRLKLKNLWGRLSNRSHVPYQRLGEILKQWAGDGEVKEPLVAKEPERKRLKVLGEEIDSETLGEILEECMSDATAVPPKRGFLGLLRRRKLQEPPSKEEVRRAAAFVVDRFGTYPGEDEEEEGEEGEAGEGEENPDEETSRLEETCRSLESERERLAASLEKLAEVQRELAEGQRNLMAGQKQLAAQQKRLVAVME